MKKKLAAFLLALATLLSLSACGGGKDRPDARSAYANTDFEDDFYFEEDYDYAEREGNLSGADAGQPMTYTFEEGALTCSGKGMVQKKDWMSVVSNALFETNQSICQDAIETVVIKRGATAIEEEAFNNCKNLTSVDIPDSVSIIGKGAFARSGLTSVELPDSVEALGAGAFSGCSNLTSVTLPNSLTALPDNLFSSCESLTTVEIPESVTTLGATMFAKSGLEKITIPAGVTKWGENVLGSCFSLKEITVLCDVTMENIEDLLLPPLKMGDNRNRLSLHLTIRAIPGSVVEGYVNKQIEKDSSKWKYAILETI